MDIPNIDTLNGKIKNSTSAEKKSEKDIQLETTSYKVKQNKGKKSLSKNSGYATGRRKNAVARVWVQPGNGKVTINNRDITDYFPRDSYQTDIFKPFTINDVTTQYDVKCTVKGGGTTGQAGAIRHGIAKALDCISETFHAKLRAHGLLTRDSRVVERKKPGKPKARKSTQFSKR